MLIINADDFGRSRAETDVALSCVRQGRVTSVTAMVFMDDSERAAGLANEESLPVGLHLNLSQTFATRIVPASLRRSHERIVAFMLKSKYAMLVYNPFLRRAFQDVFRAQYDEFVRLYGRRPTHIDGHQHRHQCANMIFDTVIPRGEKVRCNFSFASGEKSLLNRCYRRFVDHRLSLRYCLTDYFFALSTSLRDGSVPRVLELACSSDVELMTHPIKAGELGYLQGDEFWEALEGVPVGSYADLERADVSGTVEATGEVGSSGPLL